MTIKVWLADNPFTTDLALLSLLGDFGVKFAEGILTKNIKKK